MSEKETFNKTTSIERHNQWRQETIVHCKVTFYPATRTIIGVMSMFNRKKKKCSLVNSRLIGKKVQYVYMMVII